MLLHVDKDKPITIRRGLTIDKYGEYRLYRCRPYKEWSPRFISGWRSLKVHTYHRLAYCWPVPFWLAKRALRKYRTV